MRRDATREGLDGLNVPAARQFWALGKKVR
jgi:hypothetical protein